jgi:hypothetical protein
LTLLFDYAAAYRVQEEFKDVRQKMARHIENLRKKYKT